MVDLLLLAACLGAFTVKTTLAAAGVCTQNPYALILPLSNYAPAESFCSSKYPVAPCTTTITSTATITLSNTVATVTDTTGTGVVTITLDTSTITLITGTETDTVTTDTTTITSTTGTTTVMSATATSTVCTVDGNAPKMDKRDSSEHRRDGLGGKLQERQEGDIPLRSAALLSASASTSTSALEKRVGRYQIRAAKTSSTTTKSTTTTKSSSTTTKSTTSTKTTSTTTTSTTSTKPPLTTTQSTTTTKASSTTTTSTTSTKSTSSTTTTNAQAGLLSSLSSQAVSFISTACSCIESSKPCGTATVQSTIASTASITVTTDVLATLSTGVIITVTISTDTTTTVSTQGTTTTDVEATSTTGATATESADCLVGCTDSTYTAAQGCQFNVNCDQTAVFTGQTGSSVSSAQSLQDCVNQCGNDQRCNAFDFDGNALTCTLYDDSVSGAASSDPGDAYGGFTGNC